MRHFRFSAPSRHVALATLPILIALSAQVSSAAPTHDTSTLDQPLSPNIIHNLEQATHQGLTATREPDFTSIQSIKGPNPASVSHKITVLYVGANYCPFCAALRWPLTIALMRFGQFSGLRTMQSSAKDIYPDTTTVTFAKAKYKSRYVDFVPVETATRRGKPLDRLQDEPAKIFRTFNAPPYTSHAGGIPFLYIGGQWMLLGSPVIPKLYAKLDWQQISHKLANPDDMLTRIVMPQANLLTAAICQTTGQQPIKVCGSPGVRSAAGMLPPTS